MEAVKSSVSKGWTGGKAAQQLQSIGAVNWKVPEKQITMLDRLAASLERVKKAAVGPDLSKMNWTYAGPVANAGRARNYIPEWLQSNDTIRETSEALKNAATAAGTASHGLRDVGKGIEEAAENTFRNLKLSAKMIDAAVRTGILPREAKDLRIPWVDDSPIAPNISGVYPAYDTRLSESSKYPWQ